MPSVPINMYDVIVSFLLVGVLLKGIILPWIGKILVKIIKEIFLDTQREVELWNHYHKTAREKKLKR